MVTPGDAPGQTSTSFPRQFGYTFAATSFEEEGMHKLFALAVGLISIVLCGGALAQRYPTKPVKLLVTYPPGGSSDLMARVFGQKLGEVWGQTVIIESKPGAAGSIGMDFAAKQPADGYSFVVGNIGPAAVNPLLSKVPYDVQRDFVAISLISTGPNILIVHPDVPAKSLRELPRDHLASCRRDVYEPHGREGDGSSLQGRYPRGAGSRRWAHPVHLFRFAAGDAIHQGWTGARPLRDRA